MTPVPEQWCNRSMGKLVVGRRHSATVTEFLKYTGKALREPWNSTHVSEWCDYRRRVGQRPAVYVLDGRKHWRLRFVGNRTKGLVERSWLGISLPSGPEHRPEDE